MSTEEIEMKLKQEEFGKIKWEKEIWNEAIEAAARCAELNIDDCEIHNLIRKLRK